MEGKLKNECINVRYNSIGKYFCADLTNLIIAYDNRKKLKFYAGIDFIRGYYNYKIEKSSDFNYALLGASRSGHVEAIKRLISCGANDFNCALWGASFSGQICAMELLIHYGANDFNYALLGASRNGHICAIKLLKSYGANNFQEVLECARFHGQIRAMELLQSWITN